MYIYIHSCCSSNRQATLGPRDELVPRWRHHQSVSPSTWHQQSIYQTSVSILSNLSLCI